MLKLKFDVTGLGLSLTTVDYSSMLRLCSRVPDYQKLYAILAAVQHWCPAPANSCIAAGRQCSLCLSLSAITMMQPQLNRIVATY